MNAQLPAAIQELKTTCSHIIICVHTYRIRETETAITRRADERRCWCGPRNVVSGRAIRNWGRRRVTSGMRPSVS